MIETDARGQRPGGTTGSGLPDGLVDQLIAVTSERGTELTGPGGFLPELVKAVLERGMQAELTDHLGYDKHDSIGRGSGNSRNGTSKKTVQTEIGPVTLVGPRDRAGSFVSRLVKHPGFGSVSQQGELEYAQEVPVLSCVIVRCGWSMSVRPARVVPVQHRSVWLPRSSVSASRPCASGATATAPLISSAREGRLRRRTVGFGGNLRRHDGRTRF